MTRPARIRRLGRPNLVASAVHLSNGQFCGRPYTPSLRDSMARQLNKLTSLSVRNATRRGLYGDGGGLFLQVGASGSKSWVFRWKRAGRFRVMGLGPVHTITLAEAREKAR